MRSLPSLMNTGKRLCEIELKITSKFKAKKISITNVSNQQRAKHFVRLTRDLLLINTILLCGDILSNPGPGKTQCGTCLKIIRRNQGQVSCLVCNLPHHFKCLGASFENNNTCTLCTVGSNLDDCSDDEQLKMLLELLEALRCNGIWFIHQNVRSRHFLVNCVLD